MLTSSWLRERSRWSALRTAGAAAALAAAVASCSASPGGGHGLRAVHRAAAPPPSPAAAGPEGTSATVERLGPSVGFARLTGGSAAERLGSFSYRGFPDGSIEPDASWVSAHIRTETVPVLGEVTCHRLVLPQLRGALQDVADAGLAGTLHTYDGCYVPRFIGRDPSRPISLHTWGIAIDIDASTNPQGSAGTMHPRVVDIFERWGFRWGGDWRYPDPMHFELGTLTERTGPAGGG